MNLHTYKLIIVKQIQPIVWFRSRQILQPLSYKCAKTRPDAVPQIRHPDDFSKVVNPTQGAISIITKNPRWLRYEPDEDKSRHAAADPDCCEEMEQKYGWKLIEIEKIDGPIFKVDCVFKGQTEFPDWYKELESKEDEDA